MASTISAGSGGVTVTMTGGGSASALRYRNEAAASAVIAAAAAALAEPLLDYTTEIAALGAITADISAVAAIDADVVTVAAVSANVTTVAGSIANVNTVATNIANVNLVGPISADVTTVAGISGNVTTVAGISGNVTTVAGIAANVTTVAGISADVTTVAGISANVTTVAGDTADINALGPISADIAIVSSISADVTTVAGAAGDLPAVASAVADLAGLVGRTGPYIGSQDIRVYEHNAAGLVCQGWDNVANLPIIEGFTVDFAGLDFPRPYERTALVSSLAEYDWNHLMVHGQSNSIGRNALETVIHSSGSAVHKTFSVGPKMTSPAISGGSNDDDMGDPIALKEDTAVADTGGASGETSCTSTAFGADRYLTSNRGDRLVFFASAAGKGSTGMSGLSKTGSASAWYNNGPYHIEAGAREAALQSKTYGAQIICWKHGEYDQGNSTSKATYKSLFSTWQSDMLTDFRTKSGNASDPLHVLVTACAYDITTSSGATDAMAELAAESDYFHRSFPNYILPYLADGTHYTGIGQCLSGAYDGRAIGQMYEGYEPDCITELGAWSDGTYVYVRFRTPKPLTFVTDELVAATTDYGFKLSDGTGTLTIAGTLTIIDGDTVRMTPNRALGSSPVVRYARDFLDVASSPIRGAGGNLCDTTEDTVVISATTYRLRHYAWPFELPVLIQES